MRRIAKRLILAAAVLAFATVTPALAAISFGENVHSHLSGSISPKALARKPPSPVVLRFASSFWNLEGGRLPVLDELEVALNKGIHLELEDRPTCSSSELESARPQPPRACQGAIVGRGRMTVDVRYPETFIPLQTSKVVIFNGGRRDGTSTLLLHGYIALPYPSAIVVPMKIKPLDEGRYGIEAQLRIPQISDGAGSLTHLGLRFREGVFVATCPSDERLQLRQSASFRDGTQLSGTVIRTCSIAE